MLQRLIDRLYKKDKKTEEASQAKMQNTASAEDVTPVDTSALYAPAQKEEQAEAVETDAATEGPVDADALKEKIVEAMRTVYDPEIPVNIYDIGLIYDIKIEPSGMTHVQMTLTSPACPAAGILPGQVESATRSVPGVQDVNLDLTFDPPWTPDLMSDAAKLELGML